MTKRDARGTDHVHGKDSPGLLAQFLHTARSKTGAGEGLGTRLEEGCVYMEGFECDCIRRGRACAYGRGGVCVHGEGMFAY